jgi:uncharacterized protein (TIGR03663 family)
MLLVVLTFAAMVAGWRYVRTRRAAWCIAAGACVGLTHATKETCVIAWGSMAAALALALGWERLIRRRRVALRPLLRWKVLAVSVAVAAAVSAALISCLFRNPGAIADSLGTYGTYLSRANAAGRHSHPQWHYYLRMLLWARYGSGPVWTEALIVALAVVGAVAALAGRHNRGADGALLRFLAFYTACMAIAYSAIPYKTPWCMLSFLHGMILLAGVGAAALIRLLPGRALKAAAGCALAAGAVHLAWQAHRASHVCYDDPSNPYVYAQTVDDLVRLARRVEQLAGASPLGGDLPIDVVCTEDDSWPLPWYLRRFRNVAYSTDVPERLDAPIIIASGKFERRIVERLYDRPAGQSRLYVSLFPVRMEIRPWVDICCYVRHDLLEALRRGRPWTPQEPP